MYIQPKTKKEIPVSTVPAPVSFKWGSNIDSNIPFPHKAAKRSKNGRNNDREVTIVRILELSRIEMYSVLIEPLLYMGIKKVLKAMIKISRSCKKYNYLAFQNIFKNIQFLTT